MRDYCKIIAGCFAVADLVISTHPLARAQLASSQYTVTTMPESSGTYASGSSYRGCTSQSSDPLAPFNSQSVMFLGWQVGGSGETLNGAHLVYRFKLEFNQAVQITSVTVAGSGDYNSGGSAAVLRLLDKNMSVLGVLSTSALNSQTCPNTYTLNLAAASGQTFFIDEFDYSTNQRFRSQVAIAYTSPTAVVFQYGANNRNPQTVQGSALASPLSVGQSFGAHDRTLHLQAVVTPPTEASNVVLGASTGLTITPGVANSTTGVIPFDLVGNTASLAAGDSSVTATHNGTTIGQTPVSVVVPAKIGSPHNQEYGTVTGYNDLFDVTTRPPFENVFPPYVQRASMYAIVNHVLVLDQFDQPIGDPNLYAGARICEGSTDIQVVLRPDSTYEDLLGIGTAVGTQVLKTSRAATEWLNAPVHRARNDMVPADVDDLHIDCYVYWNPKIVGRQVQIEPVRGKQDEATMQVIWP